MTQTESRNRVSLYPHCRDFGLENFKNRNFRGLQLKYGIKVEILILQDTGEIFFYVLGKDNEIFPRHTIKQTTGLRNNQSYH